MEILVTTYCKYSCGKDLNLFTARPDDYCNKDEFLEACYNHHSDETSPELMFIDFSDIPNSFVRESYVNPLLWDYLDLSDYDQKIISVYLEEVHSSCTDFKYALDHFYGMYENPHDFVKEYIETVYPDLLESLPYFISNSINYNIALKELSMDFSVCAGKDNNIYVFFDL